MRPTNKHERVILARTKTRAPKQRAPLYDKWLERRLMTAADAVREWRLDNLTTTTDRHEELT